MNLKNWLLAATLIYVQSSCSTSTDETQQDILPTVVMDKHSYAMPEEAVITHLNWQANINFEEKVINAVAIFDIEKTPEADQIVLDALQFNIIDVADVEGKTLEFNLGE